MSSFAVVGEKGPCADRCPSTQLLNRIEESPFAFPLVSLTTFALAAFVTSFGLRRLARLRRVNLGWRDEVRQLQVGDKWGMGGRRGGKGGHASTTGAAARRRRD